MANDPSSMPDSEWSTVLAPGVNVCSACFRLTGAECGEGGGVKPG